MNKTVEQETVYKVGKWIKQTLIMPLSDSTKDCVMCSECKTHWELEYKYCPNCGAKMEVKDGNEYDSKKRSGCCSF